MTTEQISQLKGYNACDISDALLKLGVPGSGFLADLVSRSPTTSSSSNQITIAPASTVRFVSKNASTNKSEEEVGLGLGESNIPPDQHWVDLCVPGTIVVMQQPSSQKCAVLGGIMGLRMKDLGVRGVVVMGRVRDLGELGGLGVPVYSRATSTVGASAESKPHSLQTTLDIEGTRVSPGDLVFCDAENGVVVIPKDKIGDVLRLLPGLVGADEKVKEAVMRGMGVREAFGRFR